MRVLHRRPASTVLAYCLGVGMFAIAAPATAQTTTEELTVIGHGGGPNDDTKSYVVGFGDLNLRDQSGQKELVRRVGLAANYVCRKLHEQDVNSVPACENQATKEAMAKVRAFEKQAKENSASLTPGRPWVPPEG
jgi:UrcA family protein